MLDLTVEDADTGAVDGRKLSKDVKGLISEVYAEAEAAVQKEKKLEKMK